MLPEDGKIVPQMSESKVDFPDPLSPKSKTFSVAPTLNSGTKREKSDRDFQL
jgi:hypothetical protein